MSRNDMREKARAIIARRGLGAMANNTKWSEFFTEIKAFDISLEFKLIDEDEPMLCKRFWCPVPNYIEGGLMGPYPFYWIEWVRSGETATLAALADKVGMECIAGEGRATVYGYR
ncbi:DUF6678 family protein [Oleiagrimonas sp. MCCC 1A03011]|uniref:DUF6678 family protein n=1 Tax=Oleiagrimonas sp. MCCC 1A03011 TaxID=1926883 RepID=UPI000DC481E2|nr:DUF6678 family protein [Oleiagrimonas sp. MCCC 1A03011]RAP55354.1 hypothetical protein BTJ49_15285 [Oleiagrimonas sp. MCCC 1A03011]